uniref:hypothetical protein n=1 Tax=Alistipes sp. TaxID=1872444 RepID=UPI004055CE42
MKKFVNILLIVLLVITVALAAYAVFASPEGRDAAVSLNLMWGYFLFGAGILAALACAVWGMIQSPAGLKKSLLSALLIVAVIAISYVVASGNDVKIINLDTGGYFEHWETVLAEAGILVAYVAGAGAVLAAIYSEIANALK